VASNGTSGVSAWLGDGGGSWEYVSSGLPTTGSFLGVAIGDVDNDGDGDIAAAGDNNWGYNVFIGNNGRDWTEQSQGLASTVTAVGVELEDINNDDNLDFITNAMTDEIRVYTGNGGQGGTMSWTDESTGLTDAEGLFCQIGVADVDGDGYKDLLHVDSHGTGIYLYTSSDCDSECTWTRWETDLPTQGDYSGAWISDLDRDGDNDLVVSEIGNSKGVEVYLADANFGPLPPIANASGDVEVYSGRTVQLSGSGSHSPVGFIDAYDWNLTQKPDGSQATLSDETIVDPKRMR